MAKVIRSTYPKEFSIGLLILISHYHSFCLPRYSRLRGAQLMEKKKKKKKGGTNVYIGMFPDKHRRYHYGADPVGRISVSYPDQAG